MFHEKTNSFGVCTMTDEYPYDISKLQPSTEYITVEKKVFDILQKNNMDLMDKLEKAKEALDFYAKELISQVYSEGIPTEADQDNGSYAREALKELEND